MKDKDTIQAIKKVYDERKDFIIIGLTGRTGSGCSTIASILKNEDFKKLDLKEPKTYDFKDSDERKYSILYNFANSNNWEPFEVIPMSNIIASFIFAKGFEAFESYIKKLFENNIISSHNEESILEAMVDLKTPIDNIKDKVLKIKDNKKHDVENSEIIYKIYFNDISKITEDLKTIFKDFIIKAESKDSQLYTYLFQKIANNLRSSGDPFESTFIPKNFFTLAERTNTLIKSIRTIKKNEGKPTLICLDAIRNPYEATFFKDRYSAFYLMSVNTDDQSRRKRLTNLKYDEILSLDEIEYPDKLTKEQKFFNQNISACLEIADIHIYNREKKNNKYYFLTKQLLKYIMLMIHPGLITPTHIERCMQIAYNAKLNSGCLSRQVGAVVTGEDYSIKSVGWNDVPKGQVSCNLRDAREYCINKDEESYSCYEITDDKFNNALTNIVSNIKYDKLGGRKYPYCFKDIYIELKGKDNQVYTRALHAEENAFLQISKYGGEGLRGSTLFTTASPCELCAKKAYQIGIKKIYYIDPYPGISQKHILTFGSKDNPEMLLFYGAIGNAYISLYTSRMSYKDELEMITGYNTKELMRTEKISISQENII